MKLPYLWEQIKISDACQINPPLEDMQSLQDDTSVTFVPMVAVDEHSGEIIKPEIKTYQEVAKGFTPFQEGDILFAKITPSMENGKAAIAKNLQNGIGYGSTEFHVLRPCEQLLPDYLFYFIRQKHFRKWAKNFFTGSAGQQRVPQDFFKRTPLPLPPPPEQERIVHIQRQADKLKRLRDEQKRIIHEISVPFFVEKFGNPFKNPKRYKKTQLKDVCDFVGGGTPSKLSPDYWKGAIPWVSPKDMTLDFIADAEDHISDTAIAESTASIIPSNSILVVTRSGILKHTFPCALNLVEVAINQDLKALIPKKDINSVFLLIQLKTLAPLVLKNVRVGATVHNLETELLKKLPIILPPLKLQNEFEKLFSKIKKVGDLFRQNFIEETTLLQNVITSSFIGELTESWRQKNKTLLKQSVDNCKSALGRSGRQFVETESAPEERSWPDQPSRHWLMDQLSNLQAWTYEALREWKGTLIPSEDLDEFREQSFPVEHLENAKDRILRALHQLAELGLIARISLDNQEGDYVTAFRGLREDEFTQVSDSQYLAKKG